MTETLPPRDTDVPFTVIVEFVKEELPILDRVFDDPEIVLLVSVSVLDADIPA